MNYLTTSQTGVDPNGRLQRMDGPNLGYVLDDIEIAMLVPEFRAGMASMQRLDRNVSIYGPILTGCVLAMGIGALYYAARRRR